MTWGVLTSPSMGSKKPKKHTQMAHRPRWWFRMVRSQPLRKAMELLAPSPNDALGCLVAEPKQDQRRQTWSRTKGAGSLDEIPRGDWVFEIELEGFGNWTAPRVSPACQRQESKKLSGVFRGGGGSSSKFSCVRRQSAWAECPGISRNTPCPRPALEGTSTTLT